MTITRPHICELTLAHAEADDHGTVRIATAPGIAFTPDEADELAAEITAAATTARTYLTEQADQ